MREIGRALPVFAVALVVGAVFAVAAFLLRPFPRLALWAMVAVATLFLLSVAAVSVSALTIGFGEPRRGRLAAALVAVGGIAGVGTGAWYRGEELGYFMAGCAALFISIPALALAGLAHKWERRGNAWAGGLSRALYGLALVASLATLGAAWTGNLSHRWDLRQAKRWCVKVASEARAEKSESGRWPEEFGPYERKAGRSPRLVGPKGARYRVGGGTFEMGFEDRPSGFMNRVWWILDGESGRWRRWVGDRPAPYEDWWR